MKPKYCQPLSIWYYQEAHCVGQQTVINPIEQTDNVGDDSVRLHAKLSYQTPTMAYYIAALLLFSLQVSQLSFRQSLAMSYLKSGVPSAKRRSNVVIHATGTKVPRGVRFDLCGHWIVKRTKQQRCQGKDCPVKPLSYCEKCGVTLCISCFKDYHMFFTKFCTLLSPSVLSIGHVISLYM